MAKTEDEEIVEEGIAWPKAFIVGCFLLMVGLACLATKSAGPMWALVLLLFLGEIE